MSTEPETTTPTDDAAAPAVPAERPHLDMKPEDMFPETGQPDVSTLVNMFDHPDPDMGPPDKWLYRLTAELQPGEVVRLFQQPVHLVTRRLLAAVDEVYGEMAVRLMKAPIPGVDQRYRHSRRGRLRRLAERFADRFLDMVPRGELTFAREQFHLQQEYRAARAKLDGAVEMAGNMRDKVVAIERKLFPGLKAPTREGKSWRGDRVIAVWAGVDEEGKATEPTKEPEF